MSDRTVMVTGKGRARRRVMPLKTQTTAPHGEAIAYAFRGGEVGFITPIEGYGMPEGALFVARGEAHRLRSVIGGLSRRAYDNETLLVPGVPEAEDDAQAYAAFQTFYDRVQHALQHDLMRDGYRSVDGRAWWVAEGHPQTTQEFAVCRLIEHGHLTHTAVIARKDLTKLTPGEHA